MSCRLILIAFAITLVAIVPSFATTVYVAADNDNLYTIDPTTGVTTLVGNMGVEMTDIAFSNGAMFGVSFPASGPDSLYSINPNTGAATLIGPTSVFLNALQFGPDGTTLYAAGGSPGCGPSPSPTACNSLYTINTATGAAALVGTGTYNSSGDLEFASSLFLTSATSSTDQLFTVDPTTGAGTPVGGGIGYAQVYGLAYVPETNTLYGFNDVGNNVIAINTGTGAGTFVANYSGSFEILGAATAVPEPRAAGIMVVGFGALAGVLARRKLRKQGLDTAPLAK